MALNMYSLFDLMKELVTEFGDVFSSSMMTQGLTCTHKNTLRELGPTILGRLANPRVGNYVNLDMWKSNAFKNLAVEEDKKKWCKFIRAVVPYLPDFIALDNPPTHLGWEFCED